MKSVAIVFLVGFVAKSQILASPYPPSKRGVILNGEALGTASLEHPIEFEILGLPFSLDGGASAKGHGQAHIGGKASSKRAIILNGEALGTAGLDKPIVFEILGLPFSLDGGASAKGHGQAHIGRNVQVRQDQNAGVIGTKKAIVLTGNAKGTAGLDRPIVLEILGLPIALNGGASAEGHGQAHVGRQDQFPPNIRAVGTKKAIVLSGNAKGTAGLDRPILLEILGFPIALNGGASAEGHGQALVGRQDQPVFYPPIQSKKRGVVLTGDVTGSAGLDKPIEFEIFEIPISLNGGASAKGHGQAHIGRKS